MPDRTVVVGFEGQRSHVPTGTTVTQFLLQRLGAVPNDVLAALVNRRLVMLDFPLRGVHVELEAVRAGSREGEAVARRSATLVLLEAARELCPEARLVVGQSLAGGYFYSWHGATPLTPATVSALARRTDEICHDDRPFTRWTATWEEAEALFR